MQPYTTLYSQLLLYSLYRLYHLYYQILHCAATYCTEQTATSLYGQLPIFTSSRCTASWNAVQCAASYPYSQLSCMFIQLLHFIDSRPKLLYPSDNLP